MPAIGANAGGSAPCGGAIRLTDCIPLDDPKYPPHDPVPWKRVERIGLATLYLGDCREIAPTLTRPAAIVTDIPYGISQESGGLRSLEYGEWDYDANLGQSVLAGFQDAPSILAFCDYRQLSGLFDTFPVRSSRCVAWVKSNPTVMNGQHLLLPALEVAYYGKLPGAWFGGRCIRSVWEGPAPTEREHPTQKPVAVMRWSLLQAPDAQTVCDPFAGSGTTGVACVLEGRKFTGIEREPKYFDIACQRIYNAQRQSKLFDENEDVQKVQPEQANFGFPEK